MRKTRSTDRNEKTGKHIKGMLAVCALGFSMVAGLTACGTAEKVPRNTEEIQTSQPALPESETTTRQSTKALPEPETQQPLEAETMEVQTTETETETETETIAQNFGDEGVPFISDDHHFVYQTDEHTYNVYTYVGNDIIKLAKYYECEDQESAKILFEAEMDAGILNYPEITDVYVKNNYFVTEYSKTRWQGVTADMLDDIYGDLKLEPIIIED